MSARMPFWAQLSIAAVLAVVVMGSLGWLWGVAFGDSVISLVVECVIFAIIGGTAGSWLGRRRYGARR